MFYKKNVAVIIPSFDPDDKLLKVVSDLNLAGFENIIIVNDGSKDSTAIYFDKARKIANCRVIFHSVNLGKGRALKSAFNFILTECPDITHAVTIDSDGQHSVEDVENCCEAIEKNTDTLILGTRDFSKKLLMFLLEVGLEIFLPKKFYSYFVVLILQILKPV